MIALRIFSATGHQDMRCTARHFMCLCCVIKEASALIVDHGSAAVVTLSCTYQLLLVHVHLYICICFV